MPSMISPATPSEETLDPQAWQPLRELGHRMVDDMLDYLATVRQRPVWQPLPTASKAWFNAPLPAVGQGIEAAYADFFNQVLPYPLGNIHPRFWGWVMGTGTAVGMLAELLAAGMNTNVGGGEQAAVYVEAQVINWFKTVVGYPHDASGLLTSGSSLANLLALTVARNQLAGVDVRAQGLQDAPRRLTLYASSESHGSIQRAVEVLGLGKAALRLLPVNKAYQIDLAALETAITEDWAAGKQPCCVVGNAGTINTGAIDDLTALAAICRRHGLWFHVDCAFGGLVTLVPTLRPLVAGLEAADSLAFDLHKWLYLPAAVGCVLFRNASAHRRTFALTPDYLAHEAGRGVLGGSQWFYEYGLEFTRPFRALKVWLALKADGVAPYARLIEQNVDQAHYLAALIDAAPELMRLAPVTLNIVCFRFQAPGLDEAELSQINQEILYRLHEAGIAVPSSTTLDGKLALRCALTNHRTRRSDLEVLVNAVIRVGRTLVG